MKIAMIGHQFRLKKHYRLGENLERLDTEVCMITADRWDGKKWPQESYPGILHFVPVENEGMIFGYMMKEAWPLLKSFKPDIIFSDSEPCAAQSTLSLRWAKKLGCKLVVYTWQNIPQEQNIFWDRRETKVLVEADAVFCGNKEAWEIMSKKNPPPQHIKQIYETGIDCDLFKPMSHISKEYDCLFVGRRVFEKGVKIIDQALDKLPNIKMLWVGKGPYTPRNGEVKGFVPEEDLPIAYNGAKVFLYPCIDTSVWQEQGAFSVLEALACGTPAIITQAGSMPGILEGCDAVYPPIPQESTSDLIRAIEYMTTYLAEDEHSEFVRETAREFILAHHSLQVVADQYMKAFKEMLKND